MKKKREKREREEKGRKLIGLIKNELRVLNLKQGS